MQIRPISVTPSMSLQRFGLATSKPQALEIKKVQTVSGGERFLDIHIYHLHDPKHPQLQPQEVYLAPMPGSGLVNTGIYIDRGAMVEPEDAHGAMHFLEHLMFKGSLDASGKIAFAPGGYDEAMRKLVSDINAHTSVDHTFYYVTNIPKRHTEKAVTNLCHLVLNPALPPYEMDKERHVVLEEINRKNTDPFKPIKSQQIKDLYGESHPLSQEINRVLGKPEVIKTISPQQMREIHLAHYGPGQRKIIVTGDFDPEAVIQQLSQTLDSGSIAYTHHPSVKIPKVEPLKASINRTVYLKNYGNDNAGIDWSYRLPVINNPKDRLIGFLTTQILAGNKSSLADKALVLGHKLADTVSAECETTPYNTLFSISAKTSPKNLEAVESRLSKILETLKTDTGIKSQLDRVLDDAIYQCYSNAEKPQSVFKVLFNSFSFGFDPILYGDKLIDTLKSITVKDIQNFSQKYLIPENKITYRTLPDPEKAENLQEPGKPQKMVRFGGRLAPDEKVYSLPGNAELVIKPRKKSVDTAITLVIPGGGRQSKTYHAVRLLVGVMNRITQHKTHEQLQQWKDDKQIKVKMYEKNDLFSMSINGKTENINDMLDILSEIITAPNFDEKMLNQIKKEYKDLVESKGILAAHEMSQNHWERLYPQGHPLGNSDKRVLETLDKITPELLKLIYQQVFQPKCMKIAVAGNVDETWVKERLSAITQKLDTLNAHSVEMNDSATPAIQQSTVLTKVRNDEATQSQAKLRRSYLAPMQEDPDRYATHALDIILSDGTGRLYKTFRDNRPGLCYSVGSSYQTGFKDGLFHFGIGTDHKNLPTVMALFDHEANRLMTEPVTEDELAYVKDVMEKQPTVQQQYVLSQANDIAYHRAMNTDSLAERIEKIQALTPEHIMAVAKKVFSKPHQTTILTTPESAIKLGLTPDKAVDYDAWIKKILPASG